MSAAPRPPVVMLACVFIGFSAFLLLLDLIQALTDWGTIEMQEALRPTLTALDERGVGLTMGELLAALRWAGLVGVLLLVAALVFAIYAARGDRVSRIGVSAVAVLIGLLIVPLGWLGLIQAFFLFFAAMLLWSADARRWYAARNGAAATDDPHAPVASPIEEIEAPVAPPPPARPAQRPRAVLVAGLLTVIGSSLVGGIAAIYLLVYGLAREEYVRLVKDGPFGDMYSAGELESSMQAGFWGCLVILPLAVAGLAAGVSLLARLRQGRVATLVLAWITAAGGVVLVPFGLLATGAAVAVIVLLNRAESRAWTGGTPSGST